MTFCTTVFAQNFTTKAKYAYLMDADTGEVLVDKKSETLMSPSSMSKLMTVYIIFKYLKDGSIKLDDSFRVSKKAWSVEGSRSFLKYNSNVTVEDLIRGIIIQSGNDACVTLAEGIAGDEGSFVEQMNTLARQIGLQKSTFANSTGLPDKKHRMTSRELAMLARAIINDFPEYYHYFAEKEFKYNKIKQFNRNTLVGQMGVDGLKTGHTNAAGYGVVISSKRDDRRVVGVLNGLKSEAERAKEAKRLVNYGMMNFKNIILFKQGEVIEKIKTWNCSRNEIEAVTKTPIALTLNKISKPSGLNVLLKYNTPIECPILKDQHIADIVIKTTTDDERSYPLLAKQDVKQSSVFSRTLQNTLYHLGF